MNEIRPLEEEIGTDDYLRGMNEGNTGIFSSICLQNKKPVAGKSFDVLKKPEHQLPSACSVFRQNNGSGGFYAGKKKRPDMGGMAQLRQTQRRRVPFRKTRRRRVKFGREKENEDRRFRTLDGKFALARHDHRRQRASVGIPVHGIDCSFDTRQARRGRLEDSRDMRVRGMLLARHAVSGRSDGRPLASPLSLPLENRNF